MAGKRWRLNNFTAGIDRTDGRVTDQQNRFYDLLNYRITNTKRIKRRPPCRKTTAISNCAGLIRHRGALYTITKKGTTPTLPTIPGETITAVYFDNPDYCTDWNLLEATVFNGSIVALIEHTFPGSTVIRRIMLHVFDGKANKPTYVEDPACPTNWNPGFPFQVVGTASAGSYSSYVPRMTVSSGRLWISLPNGDVGFCKTSNPRVWNERTADDIAEQGEWYYFIIPSGASLREFIVSEAYSTLAADPGWSAYVLEYLDSSGAWQLMAEVGSAPGVDKQWYPASVASRFAGGPNEIKVQLYWTGAADTLIRLRLIAGMQPTEVVSGCEFAKIFDYDRFVGTGAATTFNSLKFSQNGSAGLGALSGLFTVVVDGVLQTYTTHYTLSWVYNSTLKTNMLRVTFVAAPASDADIIVRWDYAYLTNIEPQPNLGVIVAQAGVMSRHGASVPVLSSRRTPSGMTGGQKYLIYIELSDTTPLAANGARVYATAYTPGTMPLNGYSRYTSKILFTAVYNSTTRILEDFSDWTYGHIAGSESPFFLQRQTLYLIELAGADDAGVLPTSAQPEAGGSTVTALSALKDRLLVCYKSGSQVWSVPPQVESHYLIDSGSVGTGEQTKAWPVLMQGFVALAMARGIRGQSLTGNDLQSLRDQNIGEPIEELGYPQQQGAAYWAHMGAYITQVTSTGEMGVCFLWLDLSPENKIRAWGRWTMDNLTNIDACSLCAADRRLYFRANGFVYYFDDEDTDFTDDEDTPGTPYRSYARWHFNDLKEPFRTKHVYGLEAAHIGVAKARVYQDVQDLNQSSDVVLPDTLNSRWVPVTAVGQVIAVSIESRDPDGHEIEEIGIQYRLLGRG